MEKDRTDVGALLADASFVRWLRGTATSSENLYWRRWLAEHPDNQRLHETAQPLLRNSTYLPGAPLDVDAAWEKLARKIGRPAGDSPPRGPLFDRSRREHKSLPVLYWGLGIAAALVLLLAVGQLLFLPVEPEFRVLTTKFGEQQRLNLAGGSVIVLNGNSRLEYPAQWSETTPGHFTLEGEAYFQVSKRAPESGPVFVVRTGEGEIKVRGTVFSVCRRDRKTRVVLKQGVVEVAVLAEPHERQRYATVVRLLPGQMLSFQKGDRQLQPEYTPVDFYMSWWKDVFVLDRISFGTVIAQLEESYGIDIRVEDEKLLECTLAGSIENHDLDVIIKSLAAILQVPVVRDRNSVVFGQRP